MISEVEHFICLVAQNFEGLGGDPSREQRTGLPAARRKSSTPWWGPVGGRGPSLRRRSGPILLLDAKKARVCPTAPADELAVPLT